jgi:hypothetical protein
MKPRSVDRPLALYGKGKLGKLAGEIFHELKIRPAYVMDEKCSHKALPKDVLLAICVATEPYHVVTAPLYRAGWEDIVPVWDIIEAYPRIGLHNGWGVNEFEVKDKREIRSLCWDDAKSYSYYNAFLNWRGYREFPEDYLLRGRRPCLPSTLMDIRLRQRVSYFGDAPMKKIDIHCEGCELKTLEENMYLFQKYRPKIDVACYHSQDGLWKIQRFLMDNLTDYKFIFRMCAYMGQGAYMRCAPKRGKNEALAEEKEYATQTA